MAEEKSDKQKAVEVFVESLGASEKMLPTLRDELYEGNWGDMQKDLEDRLNGKPYIFKLVNRIESDIEGIKKLRKFEEDFNLNLNEHIKN